MCTVKKPSFWIEIHCLGLPLNVLNVIATNR